MAPHYASKDPRRSGTPSSPDPALRRTNDADDPDMSPTMMIDPRLDPRLQGALEPTLKPFYIYVERGPGNGQLVPIKQGMTVIGRASVSELRIEHPSVSRRHAQVLRRGDRLWVKDLGSQNGTYVNQARISGEVEISAGDAIGVGTAVVRVRGSELVALEQAPSTSAPRPRPAPAAKVAKARSSEYRPLKVIIVSGAIGFAAAGVITFVAVDMSRAPEDTLAVSKTMKERRTRGSAEVIEAREKRDAAASARSDEPRAPAKEVRPDEARKPAAEAPKKAEKPAPAELPKATARSLEKKSAPEKKPVAAKPPREERKVAVAPPPQPKKPVEQVREPEPPPPPAVRPEVTREAIARYQEGSLDEALAVAAEDPPLKAKLASFKEAYEAAQAALNGNDGVQAIKSFTAALKLDAQIASGKSRYGGEIRQQLSRLYTLAGVKHLESDNVDDARKAFTVALRHDPENERARSELERLSGDGSRTEKQRAIEAAWGE